MWAPADMFTPTVDAVALAMKRAFTFANDHVLALLIAFALVVIALILLAQVRRRRRD